LIKSRTIRYLRAIGTGVKHLFSNRLTCPYPDARQMVNERYRGMIRPIREKCTSCMMCARVCPSNAIKMYAVDAKKFPGIDYARCVFCGFCVDICPVRALEHTSLHDVAYLDYEENLFPPEKFVEGGKDPYIVPGGVVTVTIDAKKGLIYGKKAAILVETRERAPTPREEPAPPPQQETTPTPEGEVKA
jgi:NADH-quinone oxidoreductase subunit I